MQENVLIFMNDFLSFVYVSCLFFFGIPRVISSKTHLFHSRVDSNVCSESIFDTDWVRTQFSGRKINYTRWINRQKFNFPIFYATTVHRSMEIQFHENWFPLFACTRLIKWTDSAKILSPQNDFEFFGSDEFCRNSNTTLEHHPLSKY